MSLDREINFRTVARTSLISVRDINSLWVFPDELLQANKKYD